MLKPGSGHLAAAISGCAVPSRLSVPRLAAGLFLLLGLVLAGCMAAPRSIDAVFDPDAAAFVLDQGPATLRGQAYARPSPTAEALLAAGATIELVPATEYARARIQAQFGDRRAIFEDPAMPDPPADYERMRRVATADEIGRFAFEGVPLGRYFLVTRFAWLDGPSIRNGWIHVPVEIVAPGETVAILDGR